MRAVVCAYMRAIVRACIFAYVSGRLRVCMRFVCARSCLCSEEHRIVTTVCNCVCVCVQVPSHLELVLRLLMHSAHDVETSQSQT